MLTGRCLALVATAALLVAPVACRDVSRFSSHGDHFEGAVVQGDFVRSGVSDATTLCLTLDTDHLQDAPGALSTSDGRYHLVKLRPIPQIWHDPLSTLTFGEGRIQNLVYAAQPVAEYDGSAADHEDILVIVSLMQSDHMEVRFLRGAPGAAAAAPVFAVFNLDRQAGPCAY